MNQIAIRTSQNVVIEYELATLRERAFAFFIDLLAILMVYVVATFFLLAKIVGNLGSGMLEGALYSLVPLALFMGYHLFSEISMHGQTWGKRAMGLRVVRLDGQEAGLSDYLLRAVFHMVDTLFSGGILAALAISSSHHNQRLGDMTANTTVIRLKPSLGFQLGDILRIDSIDSYQVTYPQVQELAEQDMILIKNAVARYKAHRNKAHELAVQELSAHMQQLLDLDTLPPDPVSFLNTLVRDYIVLTR
ncbi:RDD family protein [Phaeodactylibacter luteus]|uniref:RDD family protein n=1 Tax=Phaeodactylibacter luteus TaxID=1564516 RepID=A0A5C6S0F1_9BACT|nr:RDD family protein [Phaeodactylibacter luteus]TXB68001.1 RDD family protein [Phaeodactylibacter luteus]